MTVQRESTYFMHTLYGEHAILMHHVWMHGMHVPVRMKKHSVEPQNNERNIALSVAQ